MAGTKQSRGTCTFCGQSVSKSGITRHLAACPQRQDAIQAAERTSGEVQTLVHLQVQDAFLKDFWLHLEMNGAATLKTLDDYLRAIWLECCGHLSEFTAGGWQGDEVPMARRAKQVFAPGVELTHLYDFGTTSETLVKAVAVRTGRPLTRHPIALMARNEPPPILCMECDQPATHLCEECMIEFDAAGTLCDRHAEDHPHDSYGEPIPLCNSPRMGMCGYTGPAEPPY